MTLDFEPSMPERWSSLREFIAYRVHAGGKPAKTVAADMDMGASTLSRKLAPSPGDTQRFNVDDLEHYMQVTGDTEPVYYLVAKYLQSTEARADRVTRQAEALLAQLMQLAPHIADIAKSTPTAPVAPVWETKRRA